MTTLTALEITEPEGAGRAIVTLRDPANNRSIPEISKSTYRIVSNCGPLSNCGPPYISTKKYIMICSKLIFFSFKTT